MSGVLLVMTSLSSGPLKNGLKHSGLVQARAVQNTEVQTKF